MRCENYAGISTAEDCHRQRRNGPSLCKDCNHPFDGESQIKHCNRCGQDKPVGEFSPDKKSKDGRRTYCKPCTSKFASAYQRKKKGPPPQGKPPSPRGIKPAVIKEEKPILHDRVVKVDFLDYPHLYDFLLSCPERFLRTKENMVIFAVKTVFDRERAG